MARDLTELEHLLNAAETLQQIQSRRKAIARFQVDSVLKTGAAATVFEGHHDGAAAILKLFHGEDRTDLARAQKRELSRLAAFMDQGKFRVPPLIAAWPGEGITVTAQIKGTSMGARLAACGLVERDALIGGAGQWLAHLVGPATRPAKFGGHYWLQSRGAVLDRMPAGPDGDLARRLANRIAERLPTVAGRDMIQARCHGDFAPANLIVTETALYGIDIQNAHWLPMTKDVARFLVYLQSTHPRPDAARVHGIAEPDLQALTGPLNALPPFDRSQLLPFFIGVELADKFATTDRTAKKAENLRNAITAYLDPAGAACP